MACFPTLKMQVNVFRPKGRVESQKLYSVGENDQEVLPSKLYWVLLNNLPDNENIKYIGLRIFAIKECNPGSYENLNIFNKNEK